MDDTRRPRCRPPTWVIPTALGLRQRLRPVRRSLRRSSPDARAGEAEVSRRPGNLDPKRNSQYRPEGTNLDSMPERIRYGLAWPAHLLQENPSQYPTRIPTRERLPATERRRDRGCRPAWIVVPAPVQADSHRRPGRPPDGGCLRAESAGRHELVARDHRHRSGYRCIAGRASPSWLWRGSEESELEQKMTGPYEQGLINIAEGGVPFDLPIVSDLRLQVGRPARRRRRRRSATRNRRSVR